MCGPISVSLVWLAGRTSPQPVIILLIGVWVLVPFVMFAATSRMSRRWPVPVRLALHVTIWIAIVASLTAYALDLRPAGSPAGFLFVALPPATTLAVIIIVGITTLIARRGPDVSRRGS
jgi:thiol:disulfide interchange protein